MHTGPEKKFLGRMCIQPLDDTLRRRPRIGHCWRIVPLLCCEAEAHVEEEEEDDEEEEAAAPSLDV